MEKSVLKDCDRLLTLLVAENRLEANVVSERLSISINRAYTLFEILRRDELAGGYGWGALSVNHRSETFKKFYKEKLKDRRNAHFDRFTKLWVAWAGFILSLLSLAWQAYRELC